MKTIKVVAAVICDNMKEKNKIFATARGYGELKGGWEFPGGKIEAGETPQEALKREIMEELDTIIKSIRDNLSGDSQKDIKYLQGCICLRRSGWVKIAISGRCPNRMPPGITTPNVKKHAVSLGGHLFSF